MYTNLSLLSLFESLMNIFLYEPRQNVDCNQECRQHLSNLYTLFVSSHLQLRGSPTWSGYLNDHWHGRASDTMSLETLLSSEADWRFHSEVVSAIRSFSRARYIAGIESTRFVDKREHWRYKTHAMYKFMLPYYEWSKRVQSWCEDCTNYISNSIWNVMTISELFLRNVMKTSLKCHGMMFDR